VPGPGQHLGRHQAGRAGAQDDGRQGRGGHRGGCGLGRRRRHHLGGRAAEGALQIHLHVHQPAGVALAARVERAPHHQEIAQAAGLDAEALGGAPGQQALVLVQPEGDVQHAMAHGFPGDSLAPSGSATSAVRSGVRGWPRIGGARVRRLLRMAKCARHVTTRQDKRFVDNLSWPGGCCEEAHCHCGRTERPDGRRETMMVPAMLDAKGTRILAESLFKELRENGYSRNQILSVSTELIDLVTEELKARADSREPDQAH